MRNLQRFANFKINTFESGMTLRDQAIKPVYNNGDNMSKTLSQIREELQSRNKDTKELFESLADDDKEQLFNEWLVTQKLKHGSIFPKLKAANIHQVDNEICCPNCGGNYLHHAGVEVFARQEDSNNGQHICLIGENMITGAANPLSNLRGSADAESFFFHADSDLSENYSERRGSIKIFFWCEECHQISAYYFEQNKGYTFTGWLSNE